MAVYSHSRLETFRQYPRHFFYKYVAKLADVNLHTSGRATSGSNTNCLSEA